MDNNGEFDPEMTIKERLEAQGFSYDPKGYEDYAAATSYHEADIAFGMVPADYRDVELAENPKNDSRSAIELVLNRHGYKLEDLNLDLHPSPERAFSALGIRYSEVLDEEERRGERPPRAHKKVGGAAIRQSGPKNGSDKKEPF